MVRLLSKHTPTRSSKPANIEFDLSDCNLEGNEVDGTTVIDAFLSVPHKRAPFLGFAPLRNKVFYLFCWFSFKTPKTRSTFKEMTNQNLLKANIPNITCTPRVPSGSQASEFYSVLIHALCLWFPRGSQKGMQEILSVARKEQQQGRPVLVSKALSEFNISKSKGWQFQLFWMLF